MSTDVSGAVLDFSAASYSIFDYASISGCIVKEFLGQQTAPTSADSPCPTQRLSFAKSTTCRTSRPSANALDRHRRA
jgi:hypothetical protein